MEIDPVRRRLTGVLFTGAALGTTAYIAAVTVSTLAVEDMTGRATFAGLPGAAAIAGTAVGTTALTLGIDRRGRRPGLVTGYGLGILGAVLAVTAVAAGSFLLLVTGMAVMGFGNAANQLARYAGAEIHPPERRGSALATIVWAGTIGSVLGPALLQPSGRLAVSLGRSELAGAYLVAGLFLSAALLVYLIALRPDPTSLAYDGPLLPNEPGSRRDVSRAFEAVQVRVALATLIAGQVVMVLIMTATPLHIRHHGSDLGIVGLVMSAHTLGMFALSPLTGRLTDRWGSFRVVTTGLTMLGISAATAVVGPNASTSLLVGALFVLGVGWNFCFVGGSALLTAGVPRAIRARVQGRVDSYTWISSATASLASGAFFQLTGYRMVAVGGLFLLAGPAIIVLRNRGRLAAAVA